MTCWIFGRVCPCVCGLILISNVFFSLRFSILFFIHFLLLLLRLLLLCLLRFEPERERERERRSSLSLPLSLSQLHNVDTFVMAVSCIVTQAAAYETSIPILNHNLTVSLCVYVNHLAARPSSFYHKSRLRPN